MDLEHSGLQEVANAMREDIASESRAPKRKYEQESADDARRGVHKRMNNKVADMSGHHDPEALQDYKPYGDQNGLGEHASTAAAALGVYPGMTVPQPTDISFATQPSDGDRNQDSFLDNSHQGGDSFMEGSTPSGRGSKPAVGSDEWHKVRKDNHKEGTSNYLPFC